MTNIQAYYASNFFMVVKSFKVQALMLSKLVSLSLMADQNKLGYLYFASFLISLIFEFNSKPTYKQIIAMGPRL